MARAQTSPEKPQRSWEILRRLVAPHRWRIVLLAGVSVTSAMLEALFIVLITGIGMALVTGETSVGPALGVVLKMPFALTAAGVALVVRVALSLLGVRISAALSAAVTTAQRMRLAHAYLRSSWATQDGEPAGRLQDLLTSFVSRVTGSVTTLATSITAGVSLLAFLGTGVAMDPLAIGVVIVALAAVGGILTPLRRAIRRRSRSNSKAGLTFANAVSELGSLGLEMQTFGAEGHFEGRIDELALKSSTTQRLTQQLQGSLPHVYMSLAYAALLGGVAALWVSDTGAIAAFGAVMLLMLRSLSYGQQLATASAAMAVYVPFLNTVEETLERYASEPAARGSSIPLSVAPLEADNVSFSYTEDSTALAGVTFTLHPGESLGVIGPSGAGKSTLAQLLLGLRSPSSGQILTAGVPLSLVDRDWWTARVAFVAQDANLLTGTVAENIRFFRDGVSDDDVRHAAQQANILSEINALPRGFDTHLGERGRQLSGGQRQRLSFARALAGKPELLILDEPTSALDGQSESLIRSTLMSLHGSLSVIIIAHRMSTLDVCDRIMVIEDGRMVALESPEALLKENDFYRAALAVAGIS